MPSFNTNAQNFKRLFTPEASQLAPRDATSDSSRNLLKLAGLTVLTHSSAEQVCKAAPTPAVAAPAAAARSPSPPSIYPDLPANYRLLNVLGEGAFLVVYRGVDRTTNQTVAIKVINKTDLNQKQLNNIKNEIAIMKKVKHPNILRLIEAHNTPQNCFLVLDYCDGGEIFNKIIEYTYFSEALSRHVFKQLLLAIQALHLKNVVHRDIKPENLLFELIPMVCRPKSEFKRHMRKSDDETKVDEGVFTEGVGGGTVGVIKLADFGLAKQLKPESMHRNLKTPCGTAGYTAPEVITCHDGAKFNSADRVSRKNYYSKSVDIWLLGCFLYTIMSGLPPFYDDNPEQLTLKILKGDYVFLTPWWDEVLVEAKDLISKMLVIKPEERITTEQIWQHPWLTGRKLLDPQPEAPPQTVAFPDNYFSSVSAKNLTEHVEDAGLTVPSGARTPSPAILAEHRLNDFEYIEHLEAPPLSDNLALMSPRANAIKMVFNNPVIHLATQAPDASILSNVVTASNVKFTDSNFKKNYVLLLDDDEEATTYPKTPMNLSFKNVFGQIPEDDDSEDGDDVGSLVKAGAAEDSDDSFNLAEFERDTRSSSIILGLQGDFKFTLNLNELSLLGRRKLSKSSKGSPNPNEAARVVLT